MIYNPTAGRGRHEKTIDAIVTACERSHTKLAMAFQTRYSARFERVKAKQPAAAARI